MAALYTMKQMMARKAEKALKEILDKADSNYNGKVELNDFTQILEANGVEVGADRIGSKSLFSKKYIMAPSLPLFCSLRNRTSPSLLNLLTRMARSVRKT